ncbi:hypothetical protein AAFF_G00361610 [Aldrovandia affinis]|uniref:Uncharacterized protein n=1 Tax=Aldrovandia affinis TaxID=143900 RepID=A0AAD7SIN5_9TELE|nr:hypothetical protein AAFF_G00361610 [Aldrovandia affinis]
MADKRKAMMDELAIDVAQEKSRHKEELSDARLQHEKEVLGVRARYEKELRGLHEDKNRTEEEIRSQLRDEKARTRELESLQQMVEELQAQIQSMEGTKGWFERGLKEAEETAEKSALEHQEQTRLAQKEAELRKAAENHASEAEQLRCRVEQESRDTHQVEANALREQLAQLEKSVEQEKAQNQELQAVQEKALKGESEKHGQQLKELRDQLEKSVEQEKAQNQELQTEQEKLLAQRDDVSSQLQEVNRANSRLLEQLTERGQEKDKLQQELEATRKMADKRKAMMDELAIDVAQEKSRHKEELSDARLQHEKEVLGVRARYEKELRGLHEDKNRTEEEIRSQLRDEKARTRELESLQQMVEELQAQIQSMEGTKGWLDRCQDGINLGSLDRICNTPLCLEFSHEAIGN